MTVLIPGVSKRVRESREKHRLAIKFKFWCEMKSGSQVSTAFMNIDEAEAWLQSQEQAIVGMQVVERMNKDEALDCLKAFRRSV